MKSLSVRELLVRVSEEEWEQIPIEIRREILKDRHQVGAGMFVIAGGSSGTSIQRMFDAGYELRFARREK